MLITTIFVSREFYMKVIEKILNCRFSLMETSCEQDDNFPQSICVKVNIIFLTCNHSWDLNYKCLNVVGI